VQLIERGLTFAAGQYDGQVLEVRSLRDRECLVSPPFGQEVPAVGAYDVLEVGEAVDDLGMLRDGDGNLNGPGDTGKTPFDVQASCLLRSDRGT
jgi:hypothetical protein